MSVPDPRQRHEAEAGSPDFPFEFATPFEAELSWDWDDMHMPYALTPLAAEYVRILGSGMNGRYTLFDFPQRWYVNVWNGYGYFAWHCPGTPEEVEAVVARWEAVSREQYLVMGDWWRNEAIPELRTVYATIAGTDVEGASGEALAEAWGDAWAAARRAWEIHFVAIIAPYGVMDDLADLYERLRPDATPGEAVRLVQGYGDDLFAVELGTEALAAQAAANPAIARRLLAGRPVTREDILALDGGVAFVAELDAFLAEHGHLGQSVDDLIEASWADEPGLLLRELAKRIERPASSAVRRRERLPARGRCPRRRCARAASSRARTISPSSSGSWRSPATSGRSPRATTTGSTAWRKPGCGRS